MLKAKFFQRLAIGLIIVAVGLAMVFSATRSNTAVASSEPEILSDNYYAITEELYAEAQENADAILLNFYADWCSTCNAAEPEIIDLMSEIGLNENVYAFRVNFGDNSETALGKELAKEYGVTTQSTFIVLTSEGIPFKSFFATVDREELKNAMITASRV